MSGRHFKFSKKIRFTVVPGIVVFAMMIGSIPAAFAVGSDTGNVTLASVETVVVTDIQDGVVGNIDTLKNSVNSLFGSRTDYNDYWKPGNTMHEALSSTSNGTTAIGFIESKNASQTFREIGAAYYNEDPNQWYCEYVTLPTYFGVLNGTGNGLEPNGFITPAQIAKVVSVTFEGADRIGTSDGGEWYTPYYNAIEKAFPYGANVTPEYMNSNMKRAEMAYVIAKVTDDGSLQSYIDLATSGGITAEMSSFEDFKPTMFTYSDDNILAESAHMESGEIPARFAGAIMYLNSKGIMNGDGAGHMNPLGEVRRSEVFSLIQKAAAYNFEYKQGAFAADNGNGDGGNGDGGNGDGGIVIVEDTTGETGGNTSGKFETFQDIIEHNKQVESGETWEEYMARPNNTYRWDDPSRPRLKAGDTFIAQDGTAYLLESSQCRMAEGTYVFGVGLPIATDLGRSQKGVTVTCGFRPGTNIFGWVNSKVNTKSSQTYIVFQTGEGHWTDEWSAIAAYTEPTEPGTYNGQWSDNGYFYWECNEGYEEYGSWEFAVIQPRYQLRNQ